MLSAARRTRASRRLTVPQSVSAPLLGWNTRDPFEAMEPTDAVLLDNWYPDYGGVAIRNGTAAYASGLGTGAVETLAVFTSSAFNQMLGACDGAVYDISSSGAVAAPLGSGFLSNRWQSASFNEHLFLVNGSDPGQIWNGATLSASGFTGVDTATLKGVGAFHERLYFWTGTDPTFWYGGVNSITGALTQFDFSTVQQMGGSLLAVEVLSYDGGTGIDSYTCFFMSSGELLLYSGTDPSNPNNWALVGRYALPPPIGIRAIVRYGGDVYYTTENDHQQLSKVLIALKLGETPPRTKISGAATAAVSIGASLFGWDAIYYPAGRRLIFNIPSPAGTFAQHVYNTSIQGWCRFNDMNASSWAVYNERLYFGTAAGLVRRADTGVTDLVGSLQMPIAASSQQAWNTFGSPLSKRLTAARVVVQTANAGASYLFEVGFDYRPASVITPISVPPIAAIWGVGIWGVGVWAPASVLVDTNWRVTGGDGSAFSWGIGANSRAPTTWVRTDLLVEPGNML